jgi:hypothetical protein
MEKIISLAGSCGLRPYLDSRFPRPVVNATLAHTAEVTVSSLFEAVAQGLAALRKNEWVEGIQEQFGIVKISVADVRVEHQVKIADDFLVQCQAKALLCQRRTVSG